MKFYRTFFWSLLEGQILNPHSHIGVDVVFWILSEGQSISHRCPEILTWAIAGAGHKKRPIVMNPNNPVIGISNQVVAGTIIALMDNRMPLHPISQPET